MWNPELMTARQQMILWLSGFVAGAAFAWCLGWML